MRGREVSEPVENVGEGGVELEDVDRLKGARVRGREARRGGKPGGEGRGGG